MDPQVYNYQGNISSGAAAGMFALAIGIFIFVILLYIIMAISLMKIAKRTNTENAWFAWIPILNLILMLQVAQRPMWWLIFFLVPILNIAGIVLNFIIWVDIAKRLAKPTWVGILAGLIPIIFVPYIAYSGNDSTPSTT